MKKPMLSPKLDGFNSRGLRELEDFAGTPMDKFGAQVDCGAIILPGQSKYPAANALARLDNDRAHSGCGQFDCGSETCGACADDDDVGFRGVHAGLDARCSSKYMSFHILQIRHVTAR